MACSAGIAGDGAVKRSSTRRLLEAGRLPFRSEEGLRQAPCWLAEVCSETVLCDRHRVRAAGLAPDAAQRA